MKKFFGISLFIILAVLAVSCSEPESETFDADFSLGESSEKVDLRGEELIMGLISSDFYFDDESTFHDSMLDRLSEMGKEFNCKITQVSVDDEHVIGSFYGATRYVDIIYSDPQKAEIAGALCPLSKMDIDLTDFDTYGTPNILEMGMWDGISYAVIPAKWPLSFRTNAGTFLILNENLIQKNGFTDPREHSENGTWTIENCGELIPSYYVSAGDDTVYAIGGNGGNFARAVLGAFGITCVTNTEGVIHSGYALPQAERCIDWYNDFYEAYKPYCTRKNADWGTFTFVNENRACMTLTEYLYLKDITTNVDNFGVINFPSSAFVEYGKNVVYFVKGYMLSISAAVEDPDEICECFKAFVEPFKGYETREDYIRYLTSNIFFDRRDAEFYVNIMKSASFVYRDFKLEFFNEMDNEFRSGTGATFLAQHLNQINEYAQVTVPNQQYIRYLYDLEAENN